MEQPRNRKRVADVASEREQSDESPTSPETYLELTEESLDGRRKYHGKFKFKVPTMGDRVDIGVLKARYGQQLSLDASPDNIAEALAYLNVTIDAEAAPKWWKDSRGGIGLYDFQPLLALYAKARAYEATFLGGRSKPDADEGADDDGSDADAGGSVDEPLPDTPVRRKVLATLGKGGGGADTADAGGGEPEG